jgi:predicted kinase
MSPEAPEPHGDPSSRLFYSPCGGRCHYLDVLIVVSGLPGTGKSTLSSGIAAARRAPVLSVDPVESAIVRAGVPRSWETGLAAYLVVQDLAEPALAAGLDVIVDSVSAAEPPRDGWRSLAARHDTPMRVIVCQVADTGEWRRRLATRNRGLAIPEPTEAEIAERRAEWTPWPERHLLLDASESRRSLLERALAWLGD